MVTRDTAQNDAFPQFRGGFSPPRRAEDQVIWERLADRFSAQTPADAIGGGVLYTCTSTCGLLRTNNATNGQEGDENEGDSKSLHSKHEHPCPRLLFDKVGPECIQPEKGQRREGEPQ